MNTQKQKTNQTAAGSQNVRKLGYCSTCGAQNEIVNQCGCDPNNLPTRIDPKLEFPAGAMEVQDSIGMSFTSRATYKGCTIIVYDLDGFINGTEAR